MFFPVSFSLPINIIFILSSFLIPHVFVSSSGEAAEAICHDDDGVYVGYDSHDDDDLHDFHDYLMFNSYLF